MIYWTITFQNGLLMGFSIVGAVMSFILVLLQSILTANHSWVNSFVLNSLTNCSFLITFMSKNWFVILTLNLSVSLNKIMSYNKKILLLFLK